MKEAFKLINDTISGILCHPDLPADDEPFKPFPIVLLLPDVGHDKNTWQTLAHQLAARGIASLRIDYREVEEHFDNLLSDAKASYFYLTHHALFNPNKIAVCGVELGAYVAFCLAQELDKTAHECDSLILLAATEHTVGQLNHHPLHTPTLSLVPKGSESFDIQAPEILMQISDWLMEQFNASNTIPHSISASSIISIESIEDADPHHVILLDADNCLFNKNYHRSMDKDVILHNASLIKMFQREHTEESFSKITVGCASLRQCALLDAYNAQENRTGSCLIAIEHIASAINADVSPLLLADIFGDLPVATSYHRMKEDYWLEYHIGFVPDESKLNIIYAHVHYEASMHPIEQRHLIDMYDDINPLLTDLFNFFRRYKEMIPVNVSLRFNHYDGNKIRRSKVIEGTGAIDFNYRQTIIDMMEITPPDSVRCVDHVTPEKLAMFRANRILNHKPFQPLMTCRSSRIQEEIKQRSMSQPYRASLDQALRKTQRYLHSNHHQQALLLQSHILYFEIKMGELHNVQMLITRNPSVVHVLDDYGRTSLHHAIIAPKHALGIARYLIKSGVDLFAIDPVSGLSAREMARNMEQVAMLDLIDKAITLRHPPLDIEPDPSAHQALSFFKTPAAIENLSTHTCSSVTNANI